MIAYKGFTKDLTATYGKGTYQYTVGKTLHEEQSKTRQTGFHSAEYILDCLTWYPLGSKNRFFEVEAAGSIDEETDCSMVVSTEITLKKELSLGEMALAAVKYMVLHPLREWETEGIHHIVKRDMAAGREKTSLIIARGQNPKAKAKENSVIGWILESKTGEILSAKVRMVEKGGSIKPDTWYTITKNGEVEEVEHATKEN